MYRIKLKKNNFNQNFANCLGNQLIEILNFLDNLLPPNIWYAADLDTSNFVEKTINYKDFVLKIVGVTSQLKEIAIKTEQFFSGIFISVEEKFALKNNLIEIGTEDPEFRKLNLEGLLVEIRAFDQSFFEIYSENFTIMKKISHFFNAEIEEGF